jgi:hypothetical protein
MELLNLVLALILLSIGLVAFFLALRVLFPRRIARTRMVAELMPGRALAVGVVNGLFFGILAFILLSIANNLGDFGRIVLTLPALLFIGLLSLGLSFGLGGMAELVGERLAPAQTAFRRTLWGTLALTIGSAVPFVGWFLLLPYAALVGLGAFIVGFFWREQVQPPAPPQI